MASPRFSGRSHRSCSNENAREDLCGGRGGAGVRADDGVSQQLDRAGNDYGAELVQLIHGDTNPAGPGFKERRVPGALDREYPGRHQALRHGSYVRVPTDARLTPESFTIQAFIWPIFADFGVVCLMLAVLPTFGAEESAIAQTN